MYGICHMPSRPSRARTDIFLIRDILDQIFSVRMFSQNILTENPYEKYLTENPCENPYKKYLRGKVEI
jgi:hypothetical protein